jgi:prepilin-type N-terminal cleavage/methylation domain-containing protein
VISKIKNRLASEQEGFTLIELLVVIVILGILVAIAVPSYLSFRGNAQEAAAKSNVRSAIPAAEAYYQIGSTYAAMTRATLNTAAPGIAPAPATSGANGLQAGPKTTDNQTYCIEDTEDQGAHYAWYTGGAAGTSVVTYDTTGCGAGFTLG